MLFTDFGASDIYAGQVKSILYRLAPQASVIDLAHDLPAFNARAAAHLLDALKNFFPEGSIFLCVIDPGVGLARGAVVVEADGRRYVGPDNGLMSVVAARAVDRRIWSIVWQPSGLSNSFHGRDLFAPVAAQLAAGTLPPYQLQAIPTLATNFGGDDLEKIIYVDHYGNACTGIRSAHARAGSLLLTKGHQVSGVRVFGEVPQKAPLWYENSFGLIEIAVNRGNAAQVLGLRVGDPVNWVV